MSHTPADTGPQGCISPRAVWQHQLREAGVCVCRHCSLPRPVLVSEKRAFSPHSPPQLCSSVPWGFSSHWSPHTVLSPGLAFYFLILLKTRGWGSVSSSPRLLGVSHLPSSQRNLADRDPSGTCPTGILGYSHQGVEKKRGHYQ